MKIGLFGGSFNPVHKGHVLLGHRFVAALGLERVFVVPANLPPHKAGVHLAAGEDRLAMCELAFPEDVFTVSAMELGRGGRSLTVDTVRALRSEFPADELFLLVGSDMLLYFDKWVQYKEILSLCRLCAVSRTGDEDYARMRAYAREVLEDKDDRVVILRDEPYAVSSTEIREMRARGQDVRGYVPPGVADYMESRGLYVD